jgi:heptosyltransferase-2
VIRTEKYDYVINAQRFFASGLLTALSGGKVTIGFDKNPLSFLFSKRVPHHIAADANGIHEVHRNLSLITEITDDKFVKPKLYPTEANFHKVRKDIVYISISPASVWFTKQYPKEKWIDFIASVPDNITIFLLGAKSDFDLCHHIETESKIRKPKVRQHAPQESAIQNLSGQLSFLESAALMKGALMNYVNDSAPLHFASAVNAPVTAIFCSTVPAFGFSPLSDISYIAEVKEKLPCRPCGLHGRKECPLGHFDCSKIDSADLLKNIPSNSAI